MKNRRNRGLTTMLVFAAMTVVTVSYCYMLHDRSIEIYKSSAALEARLQAQAAADGAAVVARLAGGVLPAELSIGDCRITLLEGEAVADSCRFRVEVVRAGRTILERRYMATWTDAAARFPRVEVLQ